MDNKECSNCKNFRLHYVKHAKGRYSSLSYGHCVHPRLKRRYSHDQGCCYWQGNKTMTEEISTDIETPAVE